MGEEGAVQILNEVLDRRDKNTAKVEVWGGDMIRKSGDFVDERGRMCNRTRWFNFRKAVWGPYINTRTTKLK